MSFDTQSLSSIASNESVRHDSLAVKRRVLGQLHDDLLAADVRWCLFVGAATSYRHDTVLKPFPPMYIEDYNEKNFARLLSVIDEVPPFDTLLASNCEHVSNEALALVDWVLNRNRNPTLHHVDSSVFQQISKLTGMTGAVARPSHIFKVEPGRTSSAKFKAIRQDRQLIYAFHGSRLENFHSILNHGLHNHMNKNALFGEGTYLSSELSVSMPYSPVGSGWQHSCVGSSLSCVAVCELIDDASVKRHVRDGSGSKDPRLSKVAGSIGGSVPDKYYVVRNNEMLRVKYLLVYVEQKLRNHTVRPPSGRRLLHWLSKHKFAVFLVLYGVLLLAIGLSNSRTFQTFLLNTFRI